MFPKGTHCHNLDTGGLRFWPGEECLAHREPRDQLRADHRADRSGEASPDPGAFDPGQIPGPVNVRGKDVDGYVHVVPVTPKGSKLFLETIDPSRKATRKAKEGR